MNNKTRWQQDDFYISSFHPITRNKEYIEAQLQHHADTGFNMVEFTFKSRELVLEALEICEKLGLKSIVQDSDFSGIGTEEKNAVYASEENIINTVARYAKFKNLVGYYVWDEPSVNYFPITKETTDLFRKHAPDKLGFSVMVPSYGMYAWEADSTWGNNATPLEERPFAQYVKQYVEQTDCDVISIDYYPFAVNQKANLIINDMWRDMGIVRKNALAVNRPFWFYFQGKWTFSADEFTDGIGMTYEKLGAQTFTALAYGVKQLSYFTSMSLVAVGDNSKGPLYDDVKKLNRKLYNIGKFLLDKTSFKVAHTGLDKALEPEYFLDSFERIEAVKSLPDHLVVGQLKDATAAKYIMIANKDFENAVSGKMVLDGTYNISFLNDDTGEIEHIAHSDKTDIHLAPGTGRLYILS